MNKRIAASAFVLLSCASAAALVFAQAQRGMYSPAELGSIQQTAPAKLSTDANYEVPAYSAPALELAPGEGRQEAQIYCGTCHTPRYVTMQPPLPAATWEAEVIKMNKTFGASIPEESARKILLYLQSHYTPENRKP